MSAGATHAPPARAMSAGATHAPPARAMSAAAALAPPARHLLRARDLIDARYAEPLDVATLARRAHASPAHFSRSFKRAFGETPHQYLLTRRIERAQDLLRATDLPVTDVCFAVGLRSVASFCRTFKRITGLTPTEYRAGWRVSPAATYAATIPTCIVMAWTRPRGRAGSDKSAAAARASVRA
jgi:AraC-like DNA-binding protein